MLYRLIRRWLGGRLRDGDVPFPAGNFHRILVPDLAGPSTVARRLEALSVVDPAELRLAVCLSRRHNPIARPFGNQSDGYSGPEGTAAGVINAYYVPRTRYATFCTWHVARCTFFRPSR